MSKLNCFSLTSEDMTSVFAEWERRYRTDPHAFISAFEKASTGLDSYAESCTAYFLSLFDEMGIQC